MEPAKGLGEFMTAIQLAQALGISRGAVSGLRDKGLPWIRLGRGVIFHEPSVAAWLKARERSTSP